MGFRKYLLAAYLLLIAASLSAQKLYIAENGAQRIQRSDGTGSNFELISSAGQVGTIKDIVIDEERNRVFWIEQDASFTYVKRANLTPNGGAIQLTNVVDHVRVAIANQFEALAIHKGNRELYITTTGSGGEIYRVDLDELFTITVLPAPTVSSLFASYGIEIDEVNDKMYFVNTSTTRQIQIANSNGTSPSVILNISGTLGTPHDVAVDPVGGFIYFSTNLTGIGQIYRAGLTGSSPTLLINSLPGTIKGIAIDTQNGFIYWATGAAAVGRANINGTGATNIVPGLSTANYISLDFSSPVPPKLYWTEGNLQEIHRINTDGSDFERYYFGGFSPLPTGIAIDANARTIFWADGQHNNIKRGLIGETDFDNPQIILDYPDASPGIAGLDIDPDNTMIYFADVDNGRIQRANYSNFPPSLTGSDIVTITNPFGVDLDLINRKIYYTANDLAAINRGTLYRANLDGTGQETLWSDLDPDPQRFIHDVKVDPINGLVYWVWTEANNIATIYKANINNVSGTVTPLVNPTGGEVRGIEIDPETNKIWWVCRGILGTVPPSIMQANLNDGSNRSVLHQISFLPPNANFIILDKGACAGAPISIAGSNQSICAGSAVSLSGTVSNTTSSTWSTNGDGTFSNAAQTVTTYTPGSSDVASSTVVLTLTANGAGSCLSATSSVTITISQIATVSAGNDISICSTDALTLTGTMGGSASNPKWTSSGSGSFDDNATLSTNYTPSPLDISTGSVELILTVDGQGVCPQVSDQLIVTINACGTIVIVHNGISPNGDGANDYFELRNIEALEPQNSVAIFNRWGDKVFEVDNYVNTDPARRFNGDNDKGKELPSGVYFYRIEFASGTPAMEGYLTLKR